MKTNQTSFLFMIFTLAIQLAACGVTTPIPSATATIAPSLHPTVTSTNSEQTQIPSLTPSSTNPAPTLATFVFPISSPPDGLHMAYINDGNLYFQNGSKPPLQLTHSENDWNILFFSENGEKIFFLRGTTRPFDLYSINIDGSDERALVTNKLLRIVDASYDDLTGFHNVTIVPSTHLLLFGTDQLQANNSVFWNGDILLVDTNTGKIEKLPNIANSFYVSPDGQSIALDKRGSIDVIDIEGNVIRNNLMTYTPSLPSFLPPGILWTPDSKGLNILIPVRTNFDLGYISEFTVWRYALNDSKGIQVPLSILPTEGETGMVSPDGKWILYNNDDQYAFYLGNLSTGHAELYEPQSYISYYWNSDSEHFIYETSNRILYLGSINSLPEFISEGEFLGWIDLKRFLYYTYRDKNIVLGNIDGSKEIIVVDQESFQNPTIFTFILP